MKNISFVPNVFNFEIDFDGTCLSIDSYGEPFDETQENQIVEFVEGWVKKGFIPVGEKTIGTVWKESDHFQIKGDVCVELGEDEDDDVWEEYETKVHF